MTFRVTLPDDPDLPLKEEDKHRTPHDTLEELKAEIEAMPDPSFEDAFKDAIDALITITEEVNPPEKIKVIGKLRGALELFNQR